MLEETEKQFDLNEESEFDYYFMWEWPEHIEKALRRMLWISLVEAAEGPPQEVHTHTSYVRWLVATHPDSPAAVLDFLSNIDSEDLLVRIAENPQVSGPTLARLAQSRYSGVRMAVGDNENTPIHTIKTLTRDEDLDVRYNMAANPALPASLLTDLSLDSNAYVSTRALKTMARRNPASVEHFPARARRENRKSG